jgi:hypothetical protein
MLQGLAGAHSFCIYQTRLLGTDDHMTCAAADVSVESEMIGSLVRGRIQRHDAILFEEADRS